MKFLGSFVQPTCDLLPAVEVRAGAEHARSVECVRSMGVLAVLPGEFSAPQTPRLERVDPVRCTGCGRCGPSGALLRRFFRVVFHVLRSPRPSQSSVRAIAAHIPPGLSLSASVSVARARERGKIHLPYRVESHKFALSSKGGAVDNLWITEKRRALRALSIFFRSFLLGKRR